MALAITALALCLSLYELDKFSTSLSSTRHLAFSLKCHLLGRG